MFSVKYNWISTGSVISLPEIIFSVISIPMGYFIDKRGGMGHVLTIGFIVLAISHGVFYIENPCTPDSSTCYQGILPMFLLGIANTIIQLTLYPVVNYIVWE